MYINLFKISALAVAIIFAFLLLYALCMGLAEESMKKIKTYDIMLSTVGLTEADRAKVLLYSLTTLAPTYFCIMVISLIPLFRYGAWFILVFPPCLVMISGPAIAVSDVCKELTGKKLSFWALFCGIIAVLLITGATATSFLL